jgi:DNA invertase Pin-like site-specific DNA recombinase
MLPKEDQNEYLGRNGKRCFFDKSVIREIVKAIEEGLPRREVVKQYKTARSTISGWMREYGSRAYQAGKSGHITQPQKRSMLRAIEEGRMTIQEAKIAYNISLTTTIKQWMRASVRENAELLGFNKPDMDEEKDKPPVTSDSDNKALKQALEEAQLKIKALNSLIDIAEDKFKIQIRKKPGAKRS